MKKISYYSINLIFVGSCLFYILYFRDNVGHDFYSHAVFQSARYGFIVGALFLVYAAARDLFDFGHVNQYREISVTASFQDAIQACENALKSVKCKYKVAASNEQSKTAIIRGSTKISFLSLGEKIQIKIQSDSDVTDIGIESHPTVKTTMIDWGKSKRMLDAMVEVIRKDLGGQNDITVKSWDSASTS